MPHWPLSRAARAIAAGGIIAYPTEAVFGLGCHPDNVEAIFDLLTLKQRKIEKGLILIAADLEQLLPYIKTPRGKILQRISASWPGPVTWLLPKRPDTPDWICGQHDSVAVRVTAHPLAAALCRYCDTALISTSANRNGQTPARSALTVRLQFGNHLDYILNGTTDKQASPSEIRDGLNDNIIRSAHPH